MSSTFRVPLCELQCNIYVVVLAACTAVLTVLLTSVGRLRRSAPATDTASSSLPTVPRAWPLLGHLPALGRYPHRVLTALAGRLGPVYTVWLGGRRAVIVSGQAAVRAAFSTSTAAGRLLDDRPDFELYGHYAGGRSLSFARRGAVVRLHRRIARGVVRRLIGSGRAGDVVGREAAALVAGWTADDAGESARCVDPADDVTRAVSSALYSMCYGADARLADDDEYLQLLSSKGDNSEAFSVFKQPDLVPRCARWLVVDDRQRSAVTRQMATHVRLNAERVQQRVQTAAAADDAADQDDCALDAVLAAAASPATVDRMGSVGLMPEHLTALPLEFLSAGSETSSATIIWLLRFLATHPDVQSRVHAELDQRLDAGCAVTYDDRRRLPYVEATVLEAMRLAPVVPLALPHYTSVDVPLPPCSAAGDARSLTAVPAGSIVVANLWSVGRDREVWADDVDCFRPERFLRSASTLRVGDEDKPETVTATSGFAHQLYPSNGSAICAGLSNFECGSVMSTSCSTTPADVSSVKDGSARTVGAPPLAVDRRLAEAFYPFGCGGRRCVGEPLGRLQVFVFFATIMRSCRLLPPPAEDDDASDTHRQLSPSVDGESYGDVIRPAPYKLRMVRRFCC